MPPAAATECERTGWTLLMIATRRARVGGGEGGALAGEAGADDQDVVCWHRLGHSIGRHGGLSTQGRCEATAAIAWRDAAPTRHDAAQAPVGVDDDHGAEPAQGRGAEQRAERRVAAARDGVLVVGQLADRQRRLAAAIAPSTRSARRRRGSGAASSTTANHGQR